jgi:hypothetical protein
VTDLRKLAKGRECTVRIPGVCCGNRETVVLAHYRLSGLNGMGMKPPDLIAAYACFECHNAIDRRSHMDLDRDYVRLAHAEGCFRTQAMLLREGNLLCE